MTITWEWEVGAHYGGESYLYELGVGNIGGNVANYGEYKTGTYAYRFSQAADFIAKATSASRQKRMGAFWWATLTTSGEHRLLNFVDAAGNILVEIRHGSDGVMDLRIAGVAQDTYVGMTLGQFRHIGLDVKIDNSAGWAVAYLDGVEIMRFEGNTGDADIVKALIGPSTTIANFNYYDDWYCEDTTGEVAPSAVPLRQFYEVVLSGDGNYSQLIGSDGNQVSNYALVDELMPNGDTDYVYATAADQIDSYAVTDYTVIAGMTVNAVHPFVIAKKTGTAATQVKPFLREDSTDFAGTAQDLSSTYALKIERRTTDPAGAAWDQTSINGMEVGVKSAGAFS